MMSIMGRTNYHYALQIGSEWCKEGRKGGKCDISCEGEHLVLNQEVALLV